MKPLLGLSAVLSQRAAPFRATIKAMNSLEHTAGSDQAQWDYGGFFKSILYTLYRNLLQNLCIEKRQSPIFAVSVN